MKPNYLLFPYNFCIDAQDHANTAVRFFCVRAGLPVAIGNSYIGCVLGSKHSKRLPDCKILTHCKCAQIITGGSTLPRCQELRSQDGYLGVTLSVEIGLFEFEWLQIPRRSYNGSKCPPTLRIKRGDIVNVTLVSNH